MGNEKTQTSDLLIPEIWAGMVQTEFLDRSRVLNSPAVYTDNTLAAQPGDTVSFPRFGMIGEAQEVNEGAAPEVRKLTEEKITATVKGVANAFSWTDEALRRGLAGQDIPGMGSYQLGLRLAQKVDQDLINAAFETTEANTQNKIRASKPLTFEDKTATVLSWDMFADAVSSIGDTWAPEEWATLFITSQDQAALMKDKQFVEADKLGTETAVQRGQIGSIGGWLPVVVTDKLPANTAMLAKPRTLGLLYEATPRLEPERIPGERKNIMWQYASYAVKRLDDRGILKITHKAAGGK